MGKGAAMETSIYVVYLVISNNHHFLGQPSYSGDSQLLAVSVCKVMVKRLIQLESVPLARMSCKLSIFFFYGSSKSHLNTLGIVSMEMSL